jgi:hypothetical protein
LMGLASFASLLAILLLYRPNTKIS